MDESGFEFTHFHWHTSCEYNVDKRRSGFPQSVLLGGSEPRCFWTIEPRLLCGSAILMEIQHGFVRFETRAGVAFVDHAIVSSRDGWHRGRRQSDQMQHGGIRICWWLLSARGSGGAPQRSAQDGKEAGNEAIGG